jgi:hypothetical protein
LVAVIHTQKETHAIATNLNEYFEGYLAARKVWTGLRLSIYQVHRT